MKNEQEIMVRKLKKGSGKYKNGFIFPERNPM